MSVLYVPPHEQIQTLISGLAAQSPRLVIHVVSHSTGGRVVTGALQQLAAEMKGNGSKPLHQVALLAPDIDAELFRRAAGKLAATAERITLFGILKDRIEGHIAGAGG